MVFVAGQVALDEQGAVVGAGDMVQHTEQVFNNLSLALAAAGATFSDVVKLN
jgi:enamine deaminase RidA (YjgF/YER057c/UK114 family)